MRAFLADGSPDAYEKAVDRLLASPRYAGAADDALARRRALCGHQRFPRRQSDLRRGRIAITSCARSPATKPFDEFTREQIAGDLLPNATLDQRVASAYNRLNRTSSEGGLQPKEYSREIRRRSRAHAERGLARQHDGLRRVSRSQVRSVPDQRDFYAMKAFFADIQETGLVPIAS